MPQRHWRAVGVALAVWLCAAVVVLAQTSAPAPLEGWSVGFSTTTDSVVILIDEGGELYLPQRDFDALPSVARTLNGLPSHVVELPASLASRLIGEKVRIGEVWTIDLPQAGRLHATVERFVLGYRNCGEAWGIELQMNPADRAAFHSAGAPLVLVRSGSIDAPASPAAGPLVRELSALERARISALLEAARTSTIDAVRRDTQRSRRGAYPESDRAWTAKWNALDKSLDGHQGRLMFESTAYRVASDGDLRAFVRARWSVNGDVAYALAAWVRLGPRPAIESLDTTPALTMRIAGDGVHEWDRAVPKVLGAFDVNADGRAEVLMRYEGYEGTNLVLIEYPSSPADKPRELADYGDGC